MALYGSSDSAINLAKMLKSLNLKVPVSVYASTRTQLPQDYDNIVQVVPSDDNQVKVNEAIKYLNGIILGYSSSCLGYSQIHSIVCMQLYKRDLRNRYIWLEFI